MTARLIPAAIVEAATLDELSDALSNIVVTATLWHVKGIQPLQNHLTEHGNAGSDPARVDYTTYANLFQAALAALGPILDCQQEALTCQP